MERLGFAAALVAHHRGGLAGEGREQHIAIDILRDMLGERGLARSGIAEQAEELRATPLARRLVPFGNRLKGTILLRREFHEGEG